MNANESSKNPLGAAMKDFGAFFGRSSKIQRTPPSDANGKTGVGEAVSSIQATAHTPVARPPMEEEKGVAGGADDRGLVEALEAAKALHEFVQGRHNVHKDIKRMAKSIVSAISAYQRERVTAESERKSARVVEMGISGGDGSAAPNSTPANSSKRSRAIISPDEVSGGKKKPKSDEVPVVSEGVWHTQKGRREKNKKSEVVEPEKKGSKVSRNGDAILVGANESSSYADILRKMKCDPELKSLGESVYRVRRTRKNELLIELNKGVQATDLNCHEALQKSVGEAGQVKMLSQLETIECRNVDEVTSAEDIEEALKTQVGIGETRVQVRMRTAYGGMQTAIIKVASSSAPKILAAGKIRVGWTVCPLRLVPKPKECFKCWRLGHQQWSCKGPDRTNTCMRCGEVGHRARGCSKEQKCVLCPATSSNHRMGGPDCKARG